MKTTLLLTILLSYEILPNFAFALAASPSTDTCLSSSFNNNDNKMTRFRSIRRILERPSAHWVGDGFRVYPVFADLAFKEDLSPLLMFDYGAPREVAPSPGPQKGVGMHPHRGQEVGTI